MGKDNNQESITEDEPFRSEISISSEQNSSFIDIDQRKEKKLLCPDSECNESFSHVGHVHGSGLLNHIVEYHKFNIDDLFCPYCGKKKKNLLNLYYHIREYHSNMETQCKECLKTFSSNASLKLHIKYYHSDEVKTQICHICGYSTKIKYMMERHNMKEHSTG